MDSHAPTALIYPWVKEIVARLSIVGLLLYGLSCLSVLGALALSQMSAMYYSLFLHMLGYSSLIFFISILGILLPWCHYVLLSGSGEGLTRILSLLGLVLGILLTIAMTYTLCTSKMLLASQFDAPYYILALCLISSIINLGHMKALPLRYRWRLPVCMLLLMLNIFCMETGLFLLAGLLLILQIFFIYPLLRGLYWLAPRVLSLPEKRQAPPPTSFK